MKYMKYLLLLLLPILLVGCQDEIVPPDVKRYDPGIYKGDFDFTESPGTLDEPVPVGDTLLVAGELNKDRYDTVIGEFGIEVSRAFRGDAARYRLPDNLIDQDLGDGVEWFMVELNVYNYDIEGGPLVFTNAEVGIFTKEEKQLNTVDVGLSELPENVAVYAGDARKIVLVVRVSEKYNVEKLYVGVNKALKEFDVEEYLEDDAVIEDSESGTIKYLSLEGVHVLEEFFEEADGEDIEDESNFEFEDEQDVEKGEE